MLVLIGWRTYMDRNFCGIKRDEGALGDMKAKRGSNLQSSHKDLSRVVCKKME